MLDDLRAGSPELVAKVERRLANAASKSGRYVGEMHEIAATQEAAGLTPALFAAMGDVVDSLSETELAGLLGDDLSIAVINRPGDCFAAMKHLLTDNHEPPGAQGKHVRRAIAVYRSLRAAGVVERPWVEDPAAPHGRRRAVQLTAELAPNFALNQALSPFAYAALDLLDRGVSVQVVTDAAGSRHAIDREVGLQRLDRAGAGPARRPARPARRARPPARRGRRALSRLRALTGRPAAGPPPRPPRRRRRTGRGARRSRADRPCGCGAPRGCAGGARSG